MQRGEEFRRLFYFLKESKVEDNERSLKYWKDSYQYKILHPLKTSCRDGSEIKHFLQSNETMKVCSLRTRYKGARHGGPGCSPCI